MQTSRQATQIVKLKERRQELAAKARDADKRLADRLRRLQTDEAKTERKRETRRKIIVGAIVRAAQTSRTDISLRWLEEQIQALCQRPLRTDRFSTCPRPQHVGGQGWASSDSCQSGQACAEPSSRPRAPRSGGGAQRRALTTASTRGECRSDDAPATTTSCGRRQARIHQILAVANTLERPDDRALFGLDVEPSAGATDADKAEPAAAPITARQKKVLAELVEEHPRFARELGVDPDDPGLEKLGKAKAASLIGAMVDHAKAQAPPDGR